MNVSPHTAGAVAPAQHPAETFWLRNTLKGYEVQELNGHDLARYLPQIVAVGEERDEFDPVDPDLD